MGDKENVTGGDVLTLDMFTRKHRDKFRRDGTLKQCRGSIVVDFDSRQFIGVFVEDAQDVLQNWERISLDLAKNPSREYLQELFRCAHNLKGSARSIGLDAFASVVHAIEDVIVALRDGLLQVNEDTTRSLLDAHSFMTDWVQHLLETPDYKRDSSEIIEQFRQIVRKAIPTRTDESPPPPEEEPTTELGSFLFESGDVSADSLEEASRLQKRRLGEILIDEGLAKPEMVEKALTEQKKTGRAESTIRISVGKLEGLLQAIGELSIQQSIVWHARQTNTLDSEYALNAIYLSHKITKEVQTGALSLRMMSLAGTFQRLERVIRDLASQQQKEINVVVEGGHVELDKSVIERIAEPLVHIVRNCTDHGIENPTQRGKAGKKQQASVSIQAFQDASAVRIEIGDDGRGIDPDIILNKALQKGLVKAHLHLTDREIVDFIFLPGFSTAETVTATSGRGVGMDVVKSVVDSIGGNIQVKSQVGKGTRFIISLPTSLSIVDALVIVVSGVRYAVPVQELSEIIDLTDHQVESSTDRGHMISFRGEVVPVESLAEYLPIVATAETDAENAKMRKKHKPALVVRYGENRIAFQVDRVENQASVVVRQLMQPLRPFMGFGGSTILGQGEPGMILNLNAIASAYIANVNH